MRLLICPVYQRTFKRKNGRRREHRGLCKTTYKVVTTHARVNAIDHSDMWLTWNQTTNACDIHHRKKGNHKTWHYVSEKKVISIGITHQTSLRGASMLFDAAIEKWRCRDQRETKTTTCGVHNFFFIIRAKDILLERNWIHISLFSRGSFWCCLA